MSQLVCKPIMVQYTTYRVWYGNLLPQARTLDTENGRLSEGGGTLSRGVKVAIVKILVLEDLAPPVVTIGNAKEINVGIRNLQKTD